MSNRNPRDFEQFFDQMRAQLRRETGNSDSH
jgi:hypothetical protein